MEVSDVRRRLRAAIEEARRRSAERRTRSDEASRAWQTLLTDVVVPAFHLMQSALVGESRRFTVSTPGESARLSLEHSAQDFVELSLDTARDVPAVLIRSTRGRGRHTIATERVVRENEAIATLTQEDVVAAVLEELIPFIER